MQKRFQILVLIAVATFTAPAFARSNPCANYQASQDKAQAAVKQLLDTIKERLELMEGVAQFKWESAKPIEDLDREKSILDAIPDPFDRSFTQTQIDAAKLLQQHYFDNWKEAGVDGFDETPDLANVIRPKITQLTTLMLEELALVKSLSDSTDNMSQLIRDQASEAFYGTHIDEQIVRTAIAPLLALESTDQSMKKCRSLAVGKRQESLRPNQ
jgi:chorismate mutase-like protein